MRVEDQIQERNANKGEKKRSIRGCAWAQLTQRYSLLFAGRYLWARVEKAACEDDQRGSWMYIHLRASDAYASITETDDDVTRHYSASFTDLSYP